MFRSSTPGRPSTERGGVAVGLPGAPGKRSGDQTMWSGAISATTVPTASFRFIRQISELLLGSGPSTTRLTQNDNLSFGK
jgi:hypothetical protein